MRISENLMVSEIHTNWDIAFLEQYIGDKMVSHSLRGDFNPQSDEPGWDDWYTYFNDAGLKFLQFLIGRKRSKFLRLDTKITSIEELLISFKDLEEYKNQSETLKKRMGQREC